MTNKTNPETIRDKDLDAVQGAGRNVLQVAKPGAKGVVLSSESETTYVRVGLPGESAEPSKGVGLASEIYEPNLKKR